MALQRGAYGGAQIKGSIGSQTYQAGPYGQIIRSRTVPVNPNTPAQAAVRFAMQFYAQEWNDVLTAAQRANWAAYAVATPLTNRFGELVNVGGRQMYLRSALAATTGGLIPVADAPSLPGIPAIPLVTYNFSAASGVTVTTVSPAVPAGSAITIFAGVPVNPSRNYYSGPWRAVSTITSSTTFPLTIIFPAPIVLGQRYMLRWRVTDNQGRVSNYTQDTFDTGV